MANSTYLNTRDSVRATLKQFPLIFAIAVSLVAVALFASPFRSSAGLRGACFLIAFLLLVFVWWRTSSRTIFFPVGRPLRLGVLGWILTVFIYCLLSPNILLSLQSWRGDVITPILAGLTCYILCTSARQLAVMLLALLAGLLVLTAMVIMDPFQPSNIAHAPRYIGVGWLSTWVVLLAAILPLTWLVRWQSPKLAYATGGLAMVLLFLSAWFSANRIVWLCFGLMFGIYVLFNRLRYQTIFQRLVTVLLGALVTIALFIVSSEQRAAAFPEARVNGITILLQDDRKTIWREAMIVIAERPLIGYGYADEAANVALAARFSEPTYGAVFRQAHNFILNYALQIGILGALSLLFLFAGLLYAFWQRQSWSLAASAIATCGLMLVVGFFIRNMTDDFFSRHTALLFGALVGILLAVCEWTESQLTY